MSLGELNNRKLRDFVHQNKLMDAYSNIQFYAVVMIKTAKNKVTNQNMRIMITFDGSVYGEVTLLDNDLDPYEYPTVLKARYQNMELLEDYLEISDKHPSPKIGKYTIKIFPVARLRD